MGSRYGGDYRSPGDNSAYRDPPAPRWDTERFSREREYRSSPVMERERERPFEGYGKRMEDRFGPPTGRASDTRFDERYYAEESYGPPARRVERQYYEEDEYYPRSPPGGAMVPFRPPRPTAPPRPGMIRRQSSLDTFDRKPQRRFDEYEKAREYRPPPPPVIHVPVPPRHPSPPRYAPRYEERDFEDVRISDPDQYGDDGYREVREREWLRSRSRARSRSSSSEKTSRREEVREVREEEYEEKPFPRRGKTRMPRRLAHLRVLEDLGYPFHEEGEMIVIEKALSKENIDEVVTRSKTFREREETTTVHLIESPAMVEKMEKLEMQSISDAPRSVREWDQMRAPSPKSVRSRSAVRSRRGSSPKGTIIEERKISIFKEESPERKSAKSIREISPASSRSRRRSTVGGTEIIERREIIEDDIEESNSFHAGPLALVTPHRKSDREIKEEIRALEVERRHLKAERIERRRPSRYSEVEREIIIERERPAEEIVEVKKDRKAPNPKLIRAMLSTLT